MKSLQYWLSRQRTTVRFDSTIRWGAWMKLLRRPFSGERADLRPRIEVLDRLSLGGKRSLLLIAVEGRRLLVGVGEGVAPSVSGLDEIRRTGLSRTSYVYARRPRGKRMVRG